LFAFAKLMAVETGLHPFHTKFWFLERRTTLERCLVAGAVLMLVAVVFGVIAARKWELTGFGALQPATTIRLVICSVVFLLLGGQTILAGFYFGLINLVAERRMHRLQALRNSAQTAPAHNDNGRAR